MALKELSSACSMLSLNSDLICSFYLLKRPPLLVVFSMRSRKPRLSSHYRNLISITASYHIPTLLSRQSNALGHECQAPGRIPLHVASHNAPVLMIFPLTLAEL